MAPTIKRLAPVSTDPQHETVEALLERSGRRTGRVNIRSSFVQGGTQRHPVPGPLRDILHNHDERALDLFLLHRALVSRAVESADGDSSWHSFPLDARVWARALGLGHLTGGGATAVAKLWRRLEENYHLVARGRSGRLTIISSLREDGSGAEYDSPDGKTLTERYLSLPFDYWTAEERWYRTLDLPTKAMLLVASTLKAGFILPTTRAPAWYGISTESAERGLRALRQNGLLRRRMVARSAPLSANGVTQEWHYTLQEPFGWPRRRLQVVSDTAAS